MSPTFQTPFASRDHGLCYPYLSVPKHPFSDPAGCKCQSRALAGWMSLNSMLLPVSALRPEDGVRSSWRVRGRYQEERTRALWKAASS